MRVSIIMPMRNAADFVAEAVESILAQTFEEWELLVVDDESQDAGADIVAAYDDSRIRLVRPGKRLHFAGALNHGITEAAGEFVARMDADDICRPERLQVQVSTMDAEPDLALCGTWARTFGLGKPTTLKPPSTDAGIQAALYFDCPLVHPTIMWRRKLPGAAQASYDSSYYPAEDYELWDRLLPSLRCANIPQILLDYRVREGSMTTGDWSDMDAQAARVHQRQLDRLNVERDADDALWHRRIGRGRGYRCADVDEFDIATRRLHALAESRSRFEDAVRIEFEKQLSDAWYRLCFHNLTLGRHVLSAYSDPAVAPPVETSVNRRVALAAAFVKHATVGPAASAVSQT